MESRVEGLIEMIHEVTDKSVAVGFGISTPEAVRPLFYAACLRSGLANMLAGVADLMLCLRVGPEQMSKSAHKVWQHNMGVQASWFGNQKRVMPKTVTQGCVFFLQACYAASSPLAQLHEDGPCGLS